MQNQYPTTEPQTGNLPASSAPSARVSAGPQRRGTKATPEREAELTREAVSQGVSDARRWRRLAAKGDRLHLAALAENDRYLQEVRAAAAVREPAAEIREVAALAP